MRRENKKFFPLLASCFALLVLTACGREVLYNNLSQEDANKVMVLLSQHGIPAELGEEKKQNEIFWTIKVEKSDLPKARVLIVASNVISPKAPGLQEVYQGKGSSGWIRTPAEERARYLLAQKGELINALKRLPEVVDADVVLNIPEKSKLSTGQEERPTASVVIKAQKPALGESALSEVTIQQWVANTVEGLAARDVSVLIHFVAPIGTELRPGQTVTLPKPGESQKIGEENPASTRLMGLKLDIESRQRLKIYLVIFFGVLVLLSAALIVSILQSSRTRQELKALKGGGAPALEGKVVGEQAPRLKAGQKEDKKEEEPFEE